MHQRGIAIGSFLMLVFAGAGLLGGCSSGGSNTPHTGAAGSTGAAGMSSTGAAGSGSGQAGASSTGAAGDTSGQAGASSTGAAGDTSGQAGSTTGVGGTTGAAGMATTGMAGAGAAGSTGAAGAGAGGSGGSTGAAGSGVRPSGPSAACGKDVPNEPIGSSVLHMIDITGMAQAYVPGYTHRKYCTTIPKNYDPTKPYPVIFYGPGCGATNCEGDGFTGRSDIFLVQAIAQSGTDLGGNIVPKNGSPGCFQAGKESNVDSPEAQYFDQVMDQVESKYCTDRGKIFATGTSSGAWLSNFLACARGNRIRGTASDSGGIQFAHPTCTGGAAVMELPGDSANATDQEGHQIGAAVARDLFIQLNGCSMTATNMMLANASCQVYGNCKSPVAWCNVGGSHQSGQGYLSTAGWAFWNMLAPE
jgi:hypothetical protein